MLAGKPITAQCAALVLAFSRRLFVQYYPRFTRFEAKHFLLEAARFMGGACRRCVIDNTSVMVAAGAGADAVIAPEMHAFARTLGFDFRAHRINHPDRKGRIERPFSYVEGNFLPARSSPTSPTSTARRSPGAAMSPTASKSAPSACRRRPPT
jgi:transposase